MRGVCESYWEGLVDLAEGRENAGAAEHLGGCAACQGRVAMLQRMFHALAHPPASAPESWVESAISLFPSSRSLRARLISTNFSLAGVRGRVAGDFHALFDIEGNEVRVFYRSTPAGWQVLGQAFPDVLLRRPSGQEIPLDTDHRFEFTGRDLPDLSMIALWERANYELSFPGEAMVHEP